MIGTPQEGEINQKRNETARPGNERRNVGNGPSLGCFLPPRYRTIIDAGNPNTQEHLPHGLAATGNERDLIHKPNYQEWEDGCTVYGHAACRRGHLTDDTHDTEDEEDREEQDAVNNPSP